MPQKTWIDNIKKRQNCWHIRRVVTLPDGRKHRLDKTLGDCDTVTRIQATEKAIQMVQKVEEFGLDALKSVAPQKIVTSLIALGFLLYAGVGIVTQLLGANFLEYGVLAHSPKEGQHIGIILVEIGVGITVAAVMIIIFYMFAGRKQ